MKPETTLALLGDLYDTNAQLNAMLKTANEQTKLANAEIDRLNRVIEDMTGPELPLNAAAANGHAPKAFQ